jgi:hypothetical protein
MKGKQITNRLKKMSHLKDIPQEFKTIVTKKNTIGALIGSSFD